MGEDIVTKSEMNRVSTLVVKEVTISGFEVADTKMVKLDNGSIISSITRVMKEAEKEEEQKLKENYQFEEFSKPNDSVEESDFVSSFGEKEFKSAVNSVKEYIKNGDVMQVVCSQRMSIPFNSDPVALYRAVRYLNPSPYMYYLNLKDFHIVGSSPEILARLEDGDVTVRPIAGTRSCLLYTSPSPRDQRGSGMPSSG